MTAKQNIINILEKEIDIFTYYGIVFDGKLICRTKCRVYLQPGRATSEFISQNFYELTRNLEVDKILNYTAQRVEQRRQIKEALEELIKEGRVQIKQL